MNADLMLFVVITPYLLLGVVWVWADFGSTEIIEVACFDANYNEIVGVVCEDEVLTEPLKVKINSFYPYDFLMVICWALLFMFAYDKWWSDKDE